MDPIIAIVNRNHNEARRKTEREQAKKNTKPIFISAAFATACLLFTLIGLVHPGLGMPLMVVALMHGCYHFGRCIGLGMRVR